MKTRLIKLLTLGIFIFLVPSCLTDDVPNPLPDLDPNTPEGGDMLIFSIDDILTWYDLFAPGAGDPQLNNVNRVYDWNNDGVPDMSLISKEVSKFPCINPDYEVELRFTGQILYTNQIFEFLFQDSPVFLPPNGLVAGTTQGRWLNEGRPITMIKDQTVEFCNLYYADCYAPEGVSYIPTRTNIGGQWYYGWIEVASSATNDDDDEEFLYISRFGISQTAGLRIRMGQE